MKLIYRYLIVALVLSSCIDISEEIIITKTGSGAYQLTADISQMATLVKSMQTDSLKDENGPDSLEIGMIKSMKETAEKYKQVPGIHNVNVRHDEGTMVFRIGFEFNNVNALNAALKEDGGSDKYKWRKNELTVLGAGYNPMGKEDENFEMVKMMMADAKYDLKITVPNKVKKTGNDEMEVHKNIAELHTTFGLMLGQSGSPKMVIKYK